MPLSKEDLEKQLEEARQSLLVLDEQRRKISDQIRHLEASLNDLGSFDSVTNFSPPEEKVRLFRQLFQGRQDVYARRWESAKTGRSGYQPACVNEWIQGLCGKLAIPKIRCGVCDNRQFLPLTDEVIEAHLRGVDGKNEPIVVGIYPLLPGDQCSFLALDFDQESWDADSLAFYQSCLEHFVPATRERSRSGQGCHVWIFFSEQIPASKARQLGTFLLDKTLRLRPEVGLESYDRMFPNQDKMPKGGFGNLIALPLQKEAREAENTMFIDENGQVYSDPWLHLSMLERLEPARLEELLQEQPNTIEIDISPNKVSYPQEITVELQEGVTIREHLPPALKHNLINLASFHNPEFYRRDHQRLPTYNTPRLINCAEVGDSYLTLPRGLLNEAKLVLQEADAIVKINDKRYGGVPISAPFLGTLTLEQELVKETLLQYEIGTLAAATAFGKTVLALSILASRGVNTLILVNKKALLAQWIERIKSFLDVATDDIGQFGGGKKKPSGKIDVAMIQSLYRKDKISDLPEKYGQMIVDECHHIPARSFEKVVQRFRGKYILGLSATITRRDGHHPIIVMQCGPIRYKVDAKRQAKLRSFSHKVIVRSTKFALPMDFPHHSFTIHDLYSALVEDNCRNEMILRDILNAVKEGRSPLILTERKAQVRWFAEQLKGKVRHLVVLQGGMKVREKKHAQEELLAAGDKGERVIVATGRYLGEGFDDARLDTLFLVFPISWKGLLHQYAGRLHREHSSKTEVQIYDYLDSEVPNFYRMFLNREKGYKGMGYEITYPSLWN